MTRAEVNPAARAAGAAALVLPAVLVAHLATRGAAPSTTSLLTCAAAVLLTCLLALHRMPRPALPGRASALGAAMVAGQAALALTSPTAAGGCLPTVGRGALAGWSLAGHGTSRACPPGTASAGAGTTGAATALLAALLVVAFHAAAAVLSAVASLAAHAAMAVATWVLDRVVPVLHRLAVPADAPSLIAAAPSALWRPGLDRAPAPVTRRGPPVVTG